MRTYNKLKIKERSYYKSYLLYLLLGLTALLLSLRKAPLPFETYDGAILEKIVGGIARHQASDRVIRCEINKDHPKIRKNLRKIVNLIEKASQEELVTLQHVRTQIPSIEIYATKVDFSNVYSKTTTATRILLLQDHETLQTRDGADAEALINIINEVCPDPKAPSPAQKS
jgi:hypothetical protein